MKIKKGKKEGRERERERVIKALEIACVRINK